jgi:hypothetical protein
MIAPLTKFIDWSVLQTAEVIGCLGQMSLIFRMVFLATVLPVFSFDVRADSADGPQTIPQLQAAIETVLKETKSSAWRQQTCCNAAWIVPSSRCGLAMSEWIQRRFISMPASN